MILDAELEFSNAQAPTSSGDNASTNYVDTGVAQGLIGPGGDIEIIIQVDTAADSSGDGASVTFEVETDDNSSFTSAAVLLTTGAVAEATLVAGYEVAHWRLPIKSVERYLRVNYNISGEDLTAGAFSAFVVSPNGGQTNRKSFPANAAPV